MVTCCEKYALKITSKYESSSGHLCHSKKIQYTAIFENIQKSCSSWLQLKILKCHQSVLTPAGCDVVSTFGATIHQRPGIWTHIGSLSWGLLSPQGSGAPLELQSPWQPVFWTTHSMDVSAVSIWSYPIAHTISSRHIHTHLLPCLSCLWAKEKFSVPHS